MAAQSCVARLCSRVEGAGLEQMVAEAGACWDGVKQLLSHFWKLMSQGEAVVAVVAGGWQQKVVQVALGPEEVKGGQCARSHGHAERQARPRCVGFLQEPNWTVLEVWMMVVEGKLLKTCQACSGKSSPTFLNARETLARRAPQRSLGGIEEQNQRTRWSQWKNAPWLASRIPRQVSLVSVSVAMRHWMLLSRLAGSQRRCRLLVSAGAERKGANRCQCQRLGVRMLWNVFAWCVLGVQESRSMARCEADLIHKFDRRTRHADGGGQLGCIRTLMRFAHLSEQLKW